MIGPSYFTVRFDLCDWQCCRKVLSLISVKLVCEFKSSLFFYVLSFFVCLLCLMSKLDNNFTVCEVLNIFFLHALSMLQAYLIFTQCGKSAQTRKFFWSAFSLIRTEYGDLLHKSSCTVRIRTRKNSLFGKFSHSPKLQYLF